MLCSSAGPTVGIVDVLLLVFLINGTMVRAHVLYANNLTMCPCANPHSVFHDYGYDDDGVPRDLNHHTIPFLHEESVYHLVDHLKQFKLVGSGGNAHVYEGRLRDSYQPVIIKTLNDAGFEEILHEARIMSYLQDSDFVPRLFGLIPAGPSLHDTSLVAEYIENSTSVEDLLLIGDTIPECSWINIVQQTTEALIGFHTKHVLFNDLHLNNVIVSWKDSTPYVHIIDFGHATFRKGKCYRHDGSSSFDRYDFLPPEVWFTISTPASDVYSFGKALIQIVKFFNGSNLGFLANECLNVDPQERPFLQDILRQVDMLRQERCSTLGHGRSKSAIFELDQQLEDDIFRNVDLPILSWDSLETVKVDGHHVWLRYSNQTQILIARHLPSSIEVVVKIFVNISFEEIRHEAMVNSIMNSTGFVPIFIGVTESGSLLENICIVQEYFGAGQTLGDIVDNILTLDFNVRILIAFELAEALYQFHKRGFVVNNFKSDNILIDFDESYPVIKLIDLGKSSLQQGYVLGATEESLENVDYLAPEVKKNLMTSQSSDVYSLCVILNNIFEKNDGIQMFELISHCIAENPLERPSVLEIKTSLVTIVSNLLKDYT